MDASNSRNFIFKSLMGKGGIKMTLDILILIILVGYIISGYRIGFFVEFISTFGLVGNILLAKYLVPKTIDFLEIMIKPEEYTQMYITILIVLYIILMIITSFINKFFKAQKKSQSTQIAGSLVALLKGIIIVFFLITGVKFLGRNYERIEEIYSESRAVQYFDKFLPIMYDYVPSEIQNQIRELKNNEVMNKYLENLF